MKQLLTFLTVAASITAAAPASADTDLIYDFDTEAKTAVITGSVDSEISGDIMLPLQIIMGNVHYNVIGVAPHALDNLSNVTSVSIPEDYQFLGNITATSQDVSRMEGYGAAFLVNCPKLEKVILQGTSKLAKLTGAGFLVSLDGKDTYLIPPRTKFTSTKLTMSSTCTRIGAGAFAANAGIAEIIFPGNLEFVAPDAGFHQMIQISAYSIASGASPYAIHNGALINSRTSTLVSLPRYYDSTTYYIDYTRTQNIGAYAFANNANVVKYTIPVQTLTIGDYAFAGSMISEAEIFPGTDLTKGGKGAFRDCDFLTSISLHGDNLYIPAEFASDCAILKELKTPDGRPAKVGAKAFANSNNLISFPFYGDIQWEGDSIFANTGFKEVVYGVSLYAAQDVTANSLFRGCKALTRIDMSHVSFLNAGLEFSVGTDFASDCPVLRELIFPSSVRFNGVAAQGSNALSKIVLASYSITEGPVFIYGPEGEYTPDILLRVPAGHVSAYGILPELINYSGSARGDYNVWCNGRFPCFPTDEIIWGAIFHLPAKCSSNFPAWCSDEAPEIFSMESLGNEELMKVTCTPNSDNVKMQEVAFGTGEVVSFDAHGTASTQAPLSSITDFTVYYTVEDIPMWTKYPADTFTSLSSPAVGSDRLAVKVTGKTVNLGTEASWQLFRTDGVQLGTGRGVSFSIAGIPSGIYIVRATDGPHTVTARIAI